MFLNYSLFVLHFLFFVEKNLQETWWHFFFRFLESEVDLDEAIKELHILATAPGLYPDFVKLNAVRTVGKSRPVFPLSSSVVDHSFAIAQ